MKKSYRILLGILAGVLVYALVMQPVSDRRDTMREEYEMKMLTLAKYRDFLESAPELDREMKGVEAALQEYRASLIDAQNDSIGFAKLNGYVQDIVAKSGMEVISMKTLAERKFSSYAALPLQINATADIKQMRDFLRYVSTGTYLVSIDLLDMTVLNVNMPDKIRVKVEIAGYRPL